MAAPYIFYNLLTETQRNRILAPYDPSIDPTGLGVLWQTNQSKMALASGQIFGSGLYHGTQTQDGSIPYQHTDFIFAVAGEELGMVGCLAIIILLTAIIVRCVRIGLRSQSSLGGVSVHRNSGYACFSDIGEHRDVHRRCTGDRAYAAILQLWWFIDSDNICGDGYSVRN